MDKEEHRFFSVDDPVVVAQGDIHHGADHDLVIVWRWHGEAKQQFFKQVVDSISP